jgi:hypothetical protein
MSEAPGLALTRTVMQGRSTARGGSTFEWWRPTADFSSPLNMGVAVFVLPYTAKDTCWVRVFASTGVNTPGTMFPGWRRKNPVARLND